MAAIDVTDAGAVGAGIAGRVLAAADMFVFGFFMVFVALGATASANSGFFARPSDPARANRRRFDRFAGSAFHRCVPARRPELDLRVHPENRPAGWLGAFAIGLAFAFGWTPCIGPVLATILSVAGSRDSLPYGVSLLARYAFGLGIPFLLAALAAGPVMRWLHRMRHYMRAVELFTGGLLIVTGLLFISNSLQALSLWLLDLFPVRGEIG